MSTLNLKPNPFLALETSDINHLSNTGKKGKPTSTTSNPPEMPRIFNQSQVQLTTPIIQRKRKLDEDLYETPARSNGNGALITPPRSSKRYKSAPSSPINTHDIYVSPKTPSFKQDFTISDSELISKGLNSSPSYSYSITSPRYYSFEDSIPHVTPPQSEGGSPTQHAAALSKPKVTLQQFSDGGYHQYHYPDTCYPFNIGGSAIGRSDGNLKLKTWREACDEKVRHEFNKSLKGYNAYTERLSNEAEQREQEIQMNAPALNTGTLFPNIKRANFQVSKGLNYPYVNRNRGDGLNRAKEEANLLLSLKSEIPKKVQYPLQSVPSSIQLPPLRSIFNMAAFDKSTIHPSGLSALEVIQFNDVNSASVCLREDESTFYDGRAIQYGNPIPVEQPSYVGNHYSASLIHKPLIQHPSTLPYLQESPIPRLPRLDEPYHQQTRVQVHSHIHSVHPAHNTSVVPLSSIGKSCSADAYSDLNKEVKELSDEERKTLASKKANAALKQFQSKFKAQPVLKMKKTRRSSSSVSKTPVKSLKVVPSSMNRGSRSSRSSSRKSSASSSASVVSDGEDSTHVLDKLTTEPRMTRSRSRSSSRGSSRSASIDSIQTADAPASVRSTPKRLDYAQASVVDTSYLEHQLMLPVENNYLTAIPMKAQLPALYDHSHGHSHNKDHKDGMNKHTQPISIISSHPQDHTESHNHSHNHNHNHNHSQRVIKKCMSCNSTSSPCWRPSWSPDDGQLCNSCGLRYRKTKARCYSPSCRKIPSKSEWALMIKRGKVMLDIYDEQGNVIGQAMSYRCLSCDCAMEVSR